MSSSVAIKPATRNSSKPNPIHLQVVSSMMDDALKAILALDRQLDRIAVKPSTVNPADESKASHAQASPAQGSPQSVVYAGWSDPRWTSLRNSVRTCANAIKDGHRDNLSKRCRFRGLTEAQAVHVVECFPPSKSRMSQLPFNNWLIKSFPERCPKPLLLPLPPSPQTRSRPPPPLSSPPPFSFLLHPTPLSPPLMPLPPLSFSVSTPTAPTAPTASNSIANSSATTFIATNAIPTATASQPAIAPDSTAPAPQPAGATFPPTIDNIPSVPSAFSPVKPGSMSFRPLPSEPTPVAALAYYPIPFTNALAYVPAPFTNALAYVPTPHTKARTRSLSPKPKQRHSSRSRSRSPR